MPEPAVATPPAAPAAAPPATPTPPPAAPAAPAPPAKPASRMGGALDKLQTAADKGPSKKAIAGAAEDGADPQLVKAASEPPKPAAEPAEPAKPEPAKAPAEPAKLAAKAEPEPAKPDENASSDDPEHVKKLGAWQQKQFWKKEAQKYESENTSLKERLSKSADVDAVRQRAEAAEARLKEVERRLEVTDFQQSDKFQKEFYQPYVKEWERANKVLAQIKVLDDEGQPVRQATQQDMLQLMSMDLSEAQALAEARFGKLSDRVLAKRDSLLELAERQNDALKEAREKGVESLRAERESLATAQQEAGRHFNQFVAEDEAKQDFLKQREDDTEWNALLDERRNWVTKAMSANPTDPALSATQRQEAVRDHATLRGRAIGYSMIKLENTRLRAQIDELNAKLKDFQQAEPGEGQPAPAGAPKPAAPSSPMERSLDAIQKRARQSNTPYI